MANQQIGAGGGGAALYRSLSYESLCRADRLEHSRSPLQNNHRFNLKSINQFSLDKPWFTYPNVLTFSNQITKTSFAKKEGAY